MKRVVATAVSMVMATAFIAPGAAAIAPSDDAARSQPGETLLAQSRTTTSTSTSSKTTSSTTSSSSSSSSTSSSKSSEKSSTTSSGREAATSSSTSATSEPTSSATRKPVRRGLTPIPVLVDGEFDVDYATQVSYVYVPTGYRADSENADEIRTCLSICKIYIADHVFREGSEAQREMATEMIQTSNDGITTQLYRAFPKSITEVAERYGLDDTNGAATWGKSTTTMHDVATFLAAKVEDGDFDDPVLAGLADAPSTAADGYAQDFGTAVLPGVLGTKWGWADKRNTMNASASYGRDFVVALNVLADADTTTEVAEDLFTGAPSGHIAVEDGRLVAKAPGHRQAADASPDGSKSSGDWIAGALLVLTAAGIVWTLRGRGRGD